jgi:hypothetical protein
VTFIRSALIGLAFACTAIAAAPSPGPEHPLSLPAEAAASLGVIDKLIVKVTCGRISGLRDVPDLYNIEIGYDSPSEVTLQSWPRLGAAAVSLGRWSQVVRVRSEDKVCFSVKVTVEGRTGETRSWNGKQLGVGA